MQSFFKTPGKVNPEQPTSQPAESPMTAQKPHQPYLEIFSPAPERARYSIPALSCSCRGRCHSSHSQMEAGDKDTTASLKDPNFPARACRELN